MNKANGQMTRIFIHYTNRFNLLSSRIDPYDRFTDRFAHFSLIPVIRLFVSFAMNQSPAPMNVIMLTNSTSRPI
jgi:hypothetical protein